MQSKTEDSIAVTATRRAVMLGLTATAVAPTVSTAQNAPSFSKEEKAAIALINDWVKALLAKDAEKAAAYMDEKCQYRDDPFQTTLKEGREQALKDFKILLRGLNGMTIESAYAIASPTEALVLVKRTDSFKLGDKQVSTPIAAYYRVRNGKILEWLDTPLKELPPAPPGNPLGVK